MVNEILQWGVIAFMGVFLIGLTRQLGLFLVPARDIRAQDEGPPLGRALPADLLEPDDQARLRAMIDGRHSSFAFVAFIDEFCPGCAALQAQLEELGPPHGAPTVALLRAAGDDYRARVERAFDLVVIDRQRMIRHGFSSAPLVMIVDSGLEVVHKEIAADGHAVVEKWRGLAKTWTAPSANGHGGVDLLVTNPGGDDHD